MKFQQHKKKKILFIASTNNLPLLDPALIRPGRFSTMVFYSQIFNAQPIPTILKNEIIGYKKRKMMKKNTQDLLFPQFFPASAGLGVEKKKTKKNKKIHRAQYSHKYVKPYGGSVFNSQSLHKDFTGPKEKFFKLRLARQGGSFYEASCIKREKFAALTFGLDSQMVKTNFKFSKIFQNNLEPRQLNYDELIIFDKKKSYHQNLLILTQISQNVFSSIKILNKRKLKKTENFLNFFGSSSLTNLKRSINVSVFAYYKLLKEYFIQNSTLNSNLLCPLSLSFSQIFYNSQSKIAVSPEHPGSSFFSSSPFFIIIFKKIVNSKKNKFLEKSETDIIPFLPFPFLNQAKIIPVFPFILKILRQPIIIPVPLFKLETLEEEPYIMNNSMELFRDPLDFASKNKFFQILLFSNLPGFIQNNFLKPIKNKKYFKLFKTTSFFLTLKPKYDFSIYFSFKSKSHFTFFYNCYCLKKDPSVSLSSFSVLDIEKKFSRVCQIPLAQQNNNLVVSNSQANSTQREQKLLFEKEMIDKKFFMDFEDNIGYKVFKRRLFLFADMIKLEKSLIDDKDNNKRYKNTKNLQTKFDLGLRTLKSVLSKWHERVESKYDWIRINLFNQSSSWQFRQAKYDRSQVFPRATILSQVSHSSKKKEKFFKVVSKYQAHLRRHEEKIKKKLSIKENYFSK